MSELTKVDIYKKDLGRLAMLKYQTETKLNNRPDTIEFLLDYYHDNQLKQSK